MTFERRHLSSQCIITCICSRKWRSAQGSALLLLLLTPISNLFMSYNKALHSACESGLHSMWIDAVTHHKHRQCAWPKTMCPSPVPDRYSSWNKVLKLHVPLGDVRLLVI